MIVKYTGRANVQIFNPKDYEKAGVESKRTVFTRDEPTEVPDAVGEVLISKEGIFGDFSFEKVEDKKAEAPSKPKSSSR